MLTWQQEAGKLKLRSWVNPVFSSGDLAGNLGGAPSLRVEKAEKGSNQASKTRPMHYHQGIRPSTYQIQDLVRMT